jgi:uncharacterized SAM-binding protein YcdF (DUF218 family)
VKKYDAILVLGSQPDFRTWKFPSHTYASLDRAIELINEGVAPYIVLSGDHALKFDNTGIKQPFKECDAEEAHLLSKGFPTNKILKEGESRDTLAQFYYLKNLIFRPHNMHSILMITVDFRVERIRFMWQKVMGSDYPLAIETVPFDDKDVYKSEAFTLGRQQEWLKDVTDGDDGWFKDKFYDDPSLKNS